MIENENYCYITSFLRWNVGKKTSYILGKKEISEKNLHSSYFYNYKTCPHILHQHCVRKTEDIVIMKSNKGNGVTIFDQNFYNNAIQEITSDTYKFEKLNKDANLKCEAFFMFFMFATIFFM